MFRTLLAECTVERTDHILAGARRCAYRITPVVGLVQPAAEFRPNPHEVADLFEVPLSFLMDPAHHQRRAMDWQGQRHEWFAMPYADGGIERFIWGATAAMLRNLYSFLAA